MEIREITSGKERFLDLLLIGDEQEDMVRRYLDSCRLFAGFADGKAVACCAAVRIDAGVVEIKNLAVLPEYRRMGIGRAMLLHAEHAHPRDTFVLGTGETPSTLRFYESCGYRYSHRIPRFFADNYDHPIVEEGVTLCDMLYLRKP